MQNGNETDFVALNWLATKICKENGKQQTKLQHHLYFIRGLRGGNRYGSWPYKCEHSLSIFMAELGAGMWDALCATCEPDIKGSAAANDRAMLHQDPLMIWFWEEISMAGFGSNF